MQRIIESSVQTQVINFTFDGEPVSGIQGDTIASALYAMGKRSWRRSKSGEERGIFCNMGVCFDCLVTVNGKPGIRACLERITEGMEVESNLPMKSNHGRQI